MAGSNGKTRDMDWWFDPAEVDAAEQALRRLAVDSRFAARLVEVTDD